MGLFGPPNVDKMKSKRDVYGLTKALGYQKDTSVRQAAAGVLGEIGDARAVAPLIAALRDSDEGVREASAGALVKIGAPAVAALVAGLNESETGLREATASALVKIGAPAVAALVAALKERESGLRWKAADVLARIGTPAVETLIVALKDRDSNVRQAAAGALKGIGDPRAVGPLVAALRDRDGSVCVAAAYALAAMGDPRAVEPLTAELKSDWSFTRREAAEALAAIGDLRAVKPLIAALRDSDGQVQRVAADALVKIGTGAVDALIATLKSGSKEAADTLGKIGDVRAVEPLIAALTRGDGQTRTAAADALGQIGDARAVAPLINALQDSDRSMSRAAAAALEKMAWRPGQDENGAAYWMAQRKWDKCVEVGAAAVGPLIIALKDREIGVRKGAAESLGKIGDARAVESLTAAALKDSDVDVRRCASKALEEIGDQDAMKALTEQSTMMRDRWNRNREHSENGVVMVVGNYEGCKLVASFDAATGDACALEVQFKNAMVSGHLANEAFAAWRPALSSRSLVVSESLVGVGWRTGKPFGATYTVMAIEFPGHDTDTCCNRNAKWREVNP